MTELVAAALALGNEFSAGMLVAFTAIGIGVAASIDFNLSNAWAAQTVNNAYTSGAAL